MPNQPGPSACSAMAQDLHGLAVNSLRRLRPGTFAIAEFPLRAIQVKDGARADCAVVRFDPIQREHLPLGMWFDTNRQTLGLSVSGKGGPVHIQLPGPKCRLSPADRYKRHQEKNGSHEDTVRSCRRQSKSGGVG